ncbi:hypothetical protein ACFWIQ_15210 [Kitasatospora sp. NPDC127059]|uniref:hypothetical protein n=1 Tax=unclassified Kitasatospora TaxID=2633591 RepID=UPI00364D9A5A
MVRTGGGRGVRAPARWIGHHRFRRLARLHTRTGAHLAPTSGPEFRDRATHLLGPDGIHPSPHGYATHATRVLPALLIAAARLPLPASAAPESPTRRLPFRAGGRS